MPGMDGCGICDGVAGFGMPPISTIADRIGNTRDAFSPMIFSAIFGILKSGAFWIGRGAACVWNMIGFGAGAGVGAGAVAGDGRVVTLTGDGRNGIDGIGEGGVTKIGAGFWAGEGMGAALFGAGGAIGATGMLIGGGVPVGFGAVGTGRIS